MNTTKTVDGFIFIIIDKETAKERLKNCEPIYRLHSDDTESLIEDENDLNDTLLDNDKIGIDFQLKTLLIQDYEEGAQNRFRNNDKRSFDEWLDDCITVFLED